MPEIFETQLWQNFHTWLLNYVISWSSLIQIFIIVMLFFLTRWLANLSVNKVNVYLKSKQKQTLTSFFDLSIQEIVFLIYLSFSLWAVMVIFDVLEVRTVWIDSAAALIVAWVVVRFVSGFIEHSLWARFIAILIWSIVALKILGLLESTTQLLSEYSFEFGYFKISLLTTFQAIIAFTFLFWAVNFLSDVIERRFNRSRQLNRAQKVLFVKIVKILLIAAAIIIGLKLVGIDLTALALFGGAIGLGIGFGLQKVFSNLISGIILLMDRSIQPGDVIAVGDTYGEVVNLEARYVSVVTRDGKKHLIPNENLIAEKVENWSYMDNKLRLRIPVGVSYDSDLYKVRDLLLEAAQEHPRILVDPEPKVLLRGFADYSVNFELRAWIEDPANGIGMPKSEILFLIWEKFKEHKIEIPFPQREIHIKTEAVVEKKD